MTVVTLSSAQLHAAAADVARVARSIDAATERHDRSIRSTRDAVDGVPSAWGSPLARGYVARDRSVVLDLAAVPMALTDGAGALRALARTATQLAGELAALERSLAAAEGQVRHLSDRRASADPQDREMLRALAHQSRDATQAVEHHQRAMEQLATRWTAACRGATPAVTAATQRLQRIEVDQLRDLGADAYRGLSRGVGAADLVGGLAQMLRTSLHIGRYVPAALRLRHLRGQLRTASNFYDGRRLPRRERRAMMRDHNRPLKRPVRQATARAGAARRAYLTNRPITRAGQFLANNRHYTRFIRGAGVTGAVVNGFDVVDAVRQGDTERAVTSSLGLVGSGLMVLPATAPLGAAIVVGTTIYANREAIGRGAKQAADWVGGKVSGGLKKLKGLFG